MKRALGFAMIAAPFVGLFAFVWAGAGFLTALGIFAAVAALLVWIKVAVEISQ
jgi:hypothetical protein